MAPKPSALSLACHAPSSDVLSVLVPLLERELVGRQAFPDALEVRLTDEDSCRLGQAMSPARALVLAHLSDDPGTLAACVPHLDSLTFAAQEALLRNPNLPLDALLGVVDSSTARMVRTIRVASSPPTMDLLVRGVELGLSEVVKAVLGHPDLPAPVALHAIALQDGLLVQSRQVNTLGGLAHRPDLARVLAVPFVGAPPSVEVLASSLETLSRSVPQGQRWFNGDAPASLKALRAVSSASALCLGAPSPDPTVVSVLLRTRDGAAGVLERSDLDEACTLVLFEYLTRLRSTPLGSSPERDLRGRPDLLHQVSVLEARLARLPATPLRVLEQLPASAADGLALARVLGDVPDVWEVASTLYLESPDVPASVLAAAARELCR